MRSVNSLSVNTPYDRVDINAKLDLFTLNISNGGTIETRYDGKLLSTFDPSEMYEVVNFKDAVTALIDVVENIFTPLAYKLSFKAGYQEFKLKGKEHEINGETFHEMLWLTNSSNGTKKMAVRYGLMRQICSNGMVTFSKDGGAKFALKHLTANNVNEELKKFMLELPKLDVSKQIKRLDVVAKKSITVRSLSDALVNKVGKVGNETVWQLLVDKFSSSQTDRIGTKEDALIVGINVPYTKLTDEVLDTKIRAWDVLNCYTELWRSLDSGQVERETNKILEIIENN